MEKDKVRPEYLHDEFYEWLNTMDEHMEPEALGQADEVLYQLQNGDYSHIIDKYDQRLYRVELENAWRGQPLDFLAEGPGIDYANYEKREDRQALYVKRYLDIAKDGYRGMSDADLLPIAEAQAQKDMLDGDMAYLLSAYGLSPDADGIAGAKERGGWISEEVEKIGTRIDDTVSAWTEAYFTLRQKRKVYEMQNLPFYPNPYEYANFYEGTYEDDWDPDY